MGCVMLAIGVAGGLSDALRPVHGLNPSQQSVTNFNTQLTSAPNVLLICVDTLRADHVGLYGYHRPTTPNVDAFFESGHVYERAYSVAPSTIPSVMSILTGRYPHHHGVRLIAQKLPTSEITITDRLRQAGFQTAAVVSNAVLADSASALGGRFDHYDDRVDEREPFREDMFERRAARTTDAAIDWLTTKRSPNRPHFLWVHYIDPHGPYRPPADKPVDFSHDEVVTIDPARVPRYAREPDVTDGNDYVDRYDEEIAYTDREVGRLLDAYTNLGLTDNAVIIFTADHGESMMEHEYWFWHEVNVYDEMLRVPLMIRYPQTARPESTTAGAHGTRESIPVSLIDVTPMILQVVGLPPAKNLDGVSIRPSPQPRSILCEGTCAGGGLWRGQVDWPIKTVVRHGMSNTIRESRAFNLSTDPKELTPLSVSSNDPALRALRNLIAKDPHRGGVPQDYLHGNLPGPGVAPIADEKLLLKLRGMGYVDDEREDGENDQ